MLHRGEDGRIILTRSKAQRSSVQIELIAPASEDSAYSAAARARHPRRAHAAEDEVIYTDDVVRPFDLERDVKDVDLVGISVDSKTARRSYDIAAAYRRRGVKVVLGGIHPTACPTRRCSTPTRSSSSEAEDLWPDAARGLQARRAQARLPRPSCPTSAASPMPRRDLFPSKKYIPFQVVQTMRGCPYPCEFCSVSTANGTTMRFRPADDVLARARDARQAHHVRATTT